MLRITLFVSMLVSSGSVFADEHIYETRIYQYDRAVTDIVDEVIEFYAPETWRSYGGAGMAIRLPLFYIAIRQRDFVHDLIAQDPYIDAIETPQAESDDNTVSVRYYPYDRRVFSSCEAVDDFFKKMVAPSTWAIVGGSGTLRCSRNGIFAVSQHGYVHEKIESLNDFLIDLVGPGAIDIGF